MTGAAYLTRLSAIYAELDAKVPLRPAATAAQIAALGLRVPAQLRAIWRKANGSKADRCVFARPGYLTGYGLLSVREAAREREAMRRRAPQYAGYVEPERRDRRIRDGWFQPEWLPFAGFGGGSLLLLVDFAPAPKGKADQVIAFTHDPDQISYVAPSFDRFLALSIAAIDREAEELIT